MSKSWDKPMNEATVLLSEGRPEEALQVLEEARNRYTMSGELAIASFYSNLVGSCLALQGRDRETLEAYETAERLSPSSAANKLATANHLLLRMNRPEAALTKVNEALQAAAGNKALEHAALALRGMTDLELNSYDSAIQNFRELSHPEMLKELHASSCDLRLADRLLKAHLESAACEEYLLGVDRKAELEGDVPTREAVRKVLNRSWWPEVPELG